MKQITFLNKLWPKITLNVCNVILRLDHMIVT